MDNKSEDDGCIVKFAKEAKIFLDNLRLEDLHKAVLELAKANNELKDCRKDDIKVVEIYENVKKITDFLDTHITDVIKSKMSRN